MSHASRRCCFLEDVDSGTRNHPSWSMLADEQEANITSKERPPNPVWPVDPTGTGIRSARTEFTRHPYRTPLHPSPTWNPMQCDGGPWPSGKQTCFPVLKPSNIQRTGTSVQFEHLDLTQPALDGPEHVQLDISRLEH